MLPQRSTYNYIQQSSSSSERSKQWEPVPEMEPILPSRIIRPTGRPKKSRNKETSEAQTTTKLSRKNIPNKCSKCGVFRHKATSCKCPARNTNSAQKKNKQKTTTAFAPKSLLYLDLLMLLLLHQDPWSFLVSPQSHLGVKNYL